MNLKEKQMSKNNGGDTDYYQIPKNSETLQDLIEYKELNFSQGNILKAIYRMNDDSHSSKERELNKIIWFAQRELKRIENCTQKNNS
jgi:hypothetical protein